MYYTGSTVGTLEDIYDSLYYGLGIAELGVAGFILMAGIVAAVAGFVFAVAMWVLEAIPLYKLSKKTGRKMPWLAWIPIFSGYCRLYVLADIPGDKEYDIFGKYKIKQRSNAFWIYVAINVLGSFVIGFIVTLASLLIPIVGSFSIVLNLLPMAATAVMRYIFLKDVLNIFKPDAKANNTAAIIVTALDTFVTLGFARTVYLYTLLKYEPLPQGTGDGEELVIAE